MKAMFIYWIVALCLIAGSAYGQSWPKEHAHFKAPEAATHKGKKFKWAKKIKQHFQYNRKRKFNAKYIFI